MELHRTRLRSIRRRWWWVQCAGEPNWTKIWFYDPFTGAWSHVFWQLAPLPANAAWVGLSEITALPGGDLLVVERDNLTGNFAGLKTVVKVSPSALADNLITNAEKDVYNLLPHLRAPNGWITGQGGGRRGDAERPHLRFNG